MQGKENSETDFIKDAPNKGIVLSSSLDNFEHLRITAEKDIPQPEPTITIGGAAVASPGNITGIGGASKAGKTAVGSEFIAGAITENESLEDELPGIKIRPNVNRYAVIDMDTEQSESDQQHNVRARIKKAGFKKTPDYYLSYNIRQLKYDQYQKITSEICDLAAKRIGGIHLIVIDGGADYISSTNDEDQSKAIVQYFIHLSIKHNCPVIIIVHQNPGSDKERGHFGSEVQRKCYGLLTVTKTGDISTLAPKIMRKAGNNDVPLISFKYCKEKGYYVAVEAVDKDEMKAQKEFMKLKTIAETVFAPPKSLTYSKAIEEIKEATGKGVTTAKSLFISMRDTYKIITKGQDDNYRMAI